MKRTTAASSSTVPSGTTIWEAAKLEWTKHICNLLVPVIEEGFRNIYTNCELTIAAQKNRSSRQRQQHHPDDLDYPEEGDEDMDESVSEGKPVVGVITAFKQTLKNIPKWNQEIIDQEYDRILKELSEETGADTGAAEDVLNDLVKAVFTSHILILTSVNLSGEANKKVEMNIPSSKRFVHKIYIEAARVFFRSPHLFARGFTDADQEYRYHKNASRVEAVLCESVSEATRKLMPIRTILKAYLNTPEPMEDMQPVLDEVEDITRRVSPRSNRGLRGILKSYIATTSNVLSSAAEDKDTEGAGGAQEPDLYDADGDDPNDDDKQSDDSSGEHYRAERKHRGGHGDNDSSSEDYQRRDKQPDRDADNSSEDDYGRDIVINSKSGRGRRDSMIQRRFSPERPTRRRDGSRRSNKEYEDQVDQVDPDSEAEHKRYERSKKSRDDYYQDYRSSSSSSSLKKKSGHDDDYYRRDHDDTRHRRDEDDKDDEHRHLYAKYSDDSNHSSKRSKPKEKNPPKMNIEKKHSRRHHQNVGFRLERSDEEEEDEQRKPQKRVSYKAPSGDEDPHSHYEEKRDRDTNKRRHYSQ